MATVQRSEACQAGKSLSIPDRLLLGLAGGMFCAGVAWPQDRLGNEGEDRALVVPRGAVSDWVDASGDLALRPSLALEGLGKRRYPMQRGIRGPVPAEPKLRLALSLSLRPVGSLPVVVSQSPAPTGRGRRAPGGTGDRFTSPVQGEQRDAPGMPEEPQQPVPFDPRPSSAPRRAAESETAVVGSPGPGLPDLGGTQWAMAPVRWSGNTVSSLNSTLGGGASFLNDINTLALQASSYVVAPYVAQWNGAFSYNLGKSAYSSVEGQQVKSRSSGLGYALGGEVLPLSRFPLSVNFSQGSSETRAFDVGQATRYSNFSVHQQYRPEQGPERYGASFSRGSYISATSTSTNTAVLGNFSTSTEFDMDHLLEGKHAVSANFGLTSSSADISAESSRLLTSRVSHGWRVHEDLEINNALEFSRNKTVSAQGNTAINNTANLFLATSVFTWRPFEDRPLTVTGGGNLTQTQVLSNGAEASLLNIAGNVSGTYRFSNNLSSSAGASVATLVTQAGQAFLNTQSASVSYSGDPVQVMGFNYGWGVGGGASRSASTGGVNAIGTNVSANHNLGRSFQLGDTHAVNLVANQSISRSSSDQGPSVSLTNSMSASWSSNLGEAMRANLSASFSDSVSTAATGDNHFQAANLNGAGAYQFSRYASLTANAGLNWSRTVASTAGTQTTGPQAFNGLIVDNSAPTMSGNLTIGYSHRNLFAVPLLNYSGTLMYINSLSNTRVEGSTLQGQPSQASMSMQHLVDYRLGKLAFSVRLSAMDQAGRKSASIFGSISRDFNGIFDGRW